MYHNKTGKNIGYYKGDRIMIEYLMKILRFENLKGKTLSSITGKTGDVEVIFTENNGKMYKLYNEEEGTGNDVSITIDDIIGDFDNIIESPILLAEESSNNLTDDATWTFYKLSTIKGNVTIKLYGESNGYYSESAQFAECTKR